MRDKDALRSVGVWPLPLIPVGSLAPVDSLLGSLAIAEAPGYRDREERIRED